MAALRIFRIEASVVWIKDGAANSSASAQAPSIDFKKWPV